MKFNTIPTDPKVTEKNSGTNIIPRVHLTFLQTNKQTPWKRVLLEKPRNLQLVKKHPAFYGTHSLIIANTKAHRLSLF
jgi:hypothetical protein